VSHDGDPREALAQLLGIMARLRDPEHGCPWDRAQSFRTIAPYTIEEAYEVADAIERGEPRKLEDELGDLLFQVAFHARMAEERGWFDFAAVTRGICEKLMRRHPHVFGDGPGARDAAEVSRSWEEHKARERAEAAGGGADGDPSVLAEIARALPALTRAAKLGRRAAHVGFDWENASQVREKVLEEVGELDVALARSVTPGAPELAEELGDLLLTVANWSRHLGVDPEEALRSANSKFERRFRRMERLAGERGDALETLSAAAWDALWREAKRSG
jgi:tetrapyrrole methylase family protein/MazG family protein/ATP diphosphatase